MNVGILALQGDFAEHEAVLKELGITSRQVRTIEDVQAVHRLIIPGGESTVMAKFLWEGGLGKAIQERVRQKSLPIYGTCAGAILLAKKILGKSAPKPLKLIDITMDRNAYGAQGESFEATLTVKGMRGTIPVAFIRAPLITHIGKGVEVLATHEGHPVLVRQGAVLAGTFHPEVRGAAAIHNMFMQM